MWFERLMDDCKKGLEISGKYKAIFVPVLINAAAALVFGIIFAIIAVFAIIPLVRQDFDGVNMVFVAMLGLSVFVIYLLYTGFRAALEVGAVSMFKAAAQDTKPNTSIFFEGVKKYFGRVFGTTLLFNFIFALLGVLILILLLIYYGTVGVLSGGWGMLLPSILIAIYIKPWTTIMVADDEGVFNSISKAFDFGKKYFWTLFIIALSAIMISKYLASAFGLLVALFAGWFISGVVLTYFRLVVMMVYLREKEQTMQ